MSQNVQLFLDYHRSTVKARKAFFEDDFSSVSPFDFANPTAVVRFGKFDSVIPPHHREKFKAEYKKVWEDLGALHLERGKFVGKKFGVDWNGISSRDLLLAIEPGGEERLASIAKKHEAAIGSAQVEFSRLNKDALIEVLDRKIALEKRLRKWILADKLKKTSVATPGCPRAQ